MMLQIINGITPISEISDGDHVVIANVVRKVKKVRWNRPCSWYEVTYEDEREYEVFHSGDTTLHTIHVVITL